MSKSINKQVNGATFATSLPNNLPWLLIQRDSMSLMNIAGDQQQPENSRMSALEILGRRGDGRMEKKLALLSKDDESAAIKKAAYRALNRSQYTRSKQGSKILEGIR